MIFRGNSPALPPSEALGRGWLKVDFHLHTREDPKDSLDYSALDLLQRAHALGFHLLAITLHGKVLHNPALTEAAQSLGIRLIPATELRLEGADVVILNLTQEEATELRQLRDLEAFRQRRGRSALVIAPHPYYVLGGSIGRRLQEHIELFDAIEICNFHTRWFDRNQPAIHVAGQFQKPLIATSDAHRLERFGEHYSLVEAEADAPLELIFDAIRQGCVQPVSPHYTTPQFFGHLWWIFVQHELQKRKARRTLAAKRN